MKLDGFVNKLSYFGSRFTDRNTPRQVWHISTKTGCTSFNYDQILHLQPHFFRPACFRMLLRVPGGTSTLSLPAKVTVPDFNA